MHEDIRNRLYRKQPIAQERRHEKLQAGNNYKLYETWHREGEKPRLAAGRGFRKKLFFSRTANVLCRIYPLEFLCFALECTRWNKCVSDQILTPISMPSVQLFLCPMASSSYFPENGATGEGHWLTIGASLTHSDAEIFLANLQPEQHFQFYQSALSQKILASFYKPRRIF